MLLEHRSRRAAEGAGLFQYAPATSSTGRWPCHHRSRASMGETSRSLRLRLSTRGVCLVRRFSAVCLGLVGLISVLGAAAPRTEAQFPSSGLLEWLIRSRLSYSGANWHLPRRPRRCSMSCGASSTTPACPGSSRSGRWSRTRRAPGTSSAPGGAGTCSGRGKEAGRASARPASRGALSYARCIGCRRRSPTRPSRRHRSARRRRRR